jgi:hypothetical protein
MRQKLGREERLCNERAQECAAAAEAALTGDVRTQYQRLERSWLTLARSFQLAQRLTAYLDDEKKGRAESEPRVLQTEKSKAPGYPDREWQAVSCAPFDCDLELAVVDADGAHALVFPCRRILGGWIKAQSKERIEIYPTHWRKWQDAS